VQGSQAQVATLQMEMRLMEASSEQKTEKLAELERVLKNWKLTANQRADQVVALEKDRDSAAQHAKQQVRRGGAERPLGRPSPFSVCSISPWGALGHIYIETEFGIFLKPTPAVCARMPQGLSIEKRSHVVLASCSIALRLPRTLKPLSSL
jgi:hypothetical protein